MLICKILFLQVVDTTDVTSTEATSDATPDEVVPRPIIKEIVPSPLKSTVVTVRLVGRPKIISLLLHSPEIYVQINKCIFVLNC